jgi:hypothetical protein
MSSPYLSCQRFRVPVCARTAKRQPPQQVKPHETGRYGAGNDASGTFARWGLWVRVPSSPPAYSTFLGGSSHPCVCPMCRSGKDGGCGPMRCQPAMSSLPPWNSHRYRSPPSPMYAQSAGRSQPIASQPNIMTPPSLSGSSRVAMCSTHPDTPHRVSPRAAGVVCRRPQSHTQRSPADPVGRPARGVAATHADRRRSSQIDPVGPLAKELSRPIFVLDRQLINDINASIVAV